MLNDDQPGLIMMYEGILSRAGALVLAGMLGWAMPFNLSAADAKPVDRLQFGGEITEEQANFSFTGSIKGGGAGEEAAIFSSRAVAFGNAQLQAFTQRIEFEANVVRGKLEEIILRLVGRGDIAQVRGDDLRDWSIRRDAEGNRYLVLRVDKPDADRKQIKATVETRDEFETLPVVLQPLTLVPVNPALHEGLLRVATDARLRVEVEGMTNLSRVDPADVAELAVANPGPGQPPLGFRYFATTPALSLKLDWSEPDAHRVLFEQFQLTGQIDGERASFRLQGVARTKNPGGGELFVLSGGAALIDLVGGRDFRIEHREPRHYLVKSGDNLGRIASQYATTVAALREANPGQSDELQANQRLLLPVPGFAGGYYLVFDRAGEFPVELKFDARVSERDGWRRLNFEVVPSALRPVTLTGLSTE